MTAERVTLARVEWVVRVADAELSQDYAGTKFVPNLVQWCAHSFDHDGGPLVTATVFGHTIEGTSTNTTFYEWNELPGWVPRPPEWFPGGGPQ